ncbi:MAG: TRAP transporter substrate-binding protein [Pirellulales bacterium]|nr:TRAP transporter substrate-binding protein [Pirellulales bacterium]
MPSVVNTRRGFLQLLGGGILVLHLAGCGHAVDDETRVVRLGHCSVPGKPLFNAAATFADIVNREADGHVRVEVFGQGKLGDSRLVMESTAIGTLDISCEAPLSPIVPEMALLELPYLFVDTQHAAENLNGPFGQALAERAKARGLVVLGYFTDAGRNIFNRYRDVRVPDDLRGLKIRVPEGSVWLEMMNQFGAMAIPLSWGEVYTAIEQNVIAGAETDLISIERACFHETCKHVSETNHVLLVYPLIMNRQRFETLSPSDQRLFARACREAAKRERNQLQSRLDEARRKLEAQGVSIIKVDQALFRDKVLEMHQRYAKELHVEDLMALITPPGAPKQTEETSK